MSSTSLTSTYSDSEIGSPSPLRHNPCLMTPLSAILLLLLAFLTTLTLFLSIPQFALGIITALLLKKSNWFVEFLYPSSLARWGHLFIMRYNFAKHPSTAFHSRTTETRIELNEHIYVHCISQFLDNVAYLIVCNDETSDGTLDAIVIDVGDVAVLTSQIESIASVHYKNRTIVLHAVISTHKHHDHTAGNRDVKVETIYGGAVENVPYCTHKVKNGDLIGLPESMGRYCEMEVIAVPSHTRGSIVLALRSTTANTNEEFLFTGDAMFSGGGGIPFEADILDTWKENVNKKKYNSPVQPSGGNNSLERIFCEILIRCRHPTNALVFPGHEYTYNLIQRQFDPSPQNPFVVDWTSNANCMKCPSYITFPPHVFFKTVSNYFVSAHKRTLPRQAGKMLTIPTTLSREMDINSHYRMLKKRGAMLLTAFRVWHVLLAERKGQEAASLDETARYAMPTKQHNPQPQSIPSPPTSPRNKPNPSNIHTLTSTDIQHEIFTTIYTHDLQSIISSLQNQTMSPEQAANQLSTLESKLFQPLVSKRPIPNTLPSQKLIWMGTLNLAILGSPPTALSKRDADKMNLPPPVLKKKSDYILISKSRLLNALLRLNLLSSLEEGECEDVRIINLLWKEASQILPSQEQQRQEEQNPSTSSSSMPNYESMELAVNQTPIPDNLELGHLKMTLYGLYHTKSGKCCYCMPCCNSKNDINVVTLNVPDNNNINENSITKNKVKRTGGELIRHSVESCPICNSQIKCQHEENKEEEEEKEEEGRKSIVSFSQEEETPRKSFRTDILETMTSPSMEDSQMEIVALAEGS